MESEKLSFSELAEIVDHPTQTELRTWQSTGVLDWIKESMAVRARVYEIGDKKLGYLYAYQHGPLVKRRLLQAGIRLAGVLNALFDSPAPSIPDQLPSRYRRLSAHRWEPFLRLRSPPPEFCCRSSCISSIAFGRPAAGRAG